MKTKCLNCGNDTFEEKLVSMTIEKNDKLFKIDNIPAKVCTRCEEEYFSAETYDSVYKMINNDMKVEFDFSKAERGKFYREDKIFLI